MKLKSIVAIAAGLAFAGAVIAAEADGKCSKASCAKKAAPAKKAEAKCSKKAEAKCSKKAEAKCSKKAAGK